MKKFFTALTFALAVAVFFPTMTCAALNSVPVTYLNRILGNWYDTKGNLVLSISNDYKINGCTVMSVKHDENTYSEWYEIKINEGNRYRDINLNHEGLDYHEYLTIRFESGKVYQLRRTKEPRYFESVGGIYIGMAEDEVLRLYGQPSIKAGEIWIYDNEGFEIGIYPCVNYVGIYKKGNKRFDWSGLSANSSKADFVYKYGNRVSYKYKDDEDGYIDIGHGEKIEFRKDMIILSTARKIF